MMPAMMPARSCSPPRVAETLLTSETSKASGSAPYFSTLASSVADCWVKLPEICGPAARDGRADRRRGDRLAVQHDREPVLRVGPAGEISRVAFSKARRTVGVELQVDDPADVVLRDSGDGAW